MKTLRHFSAWLVLAALCSAPLSAQPTPVSGGGSGTGSVTSVAVTGTDGIEVDSGSPVTTSGTITLGLNASTTKTTLSLNNVDNTSDATKDAAATTLTNKTLASPTITGTATMSGGSAVIDVSSGNGTISATGGGSITISAPTIITGAVKDSASSFGSSGQVLKTNGSGVLTYQNNLGSYVLRLNAGGGGNLAATQTAYAGWQPANGGNQVQGRYRVYIPKTGTIRTIIFYFYGGGGSAHNLTVDVWLNNTTAVGQTTLVANVFPGIAASTGLSQAVTGNGTSGDYIELRATLEAGATTISSLAIACDVYIETAL